MFNGANTYPAKLMLFRETARGETQGTGLLFLLLNYFPDELTEKDSRNKRRSNSLSFIMNNAIDKPVKLGESGKLFQVKRGSNVLLWKIIESLSCLQ